MYRAYTYGMKKSIAPPPNCIDYYVIKIEEKEKLQCRSMSD